MATPVWNPFNPQDISSITGSYDATRDETVNALGNNKSGSDLVRTTKPYSDFNGDYWAYLNYMAEKGDSASLDKLMNYFLSEQSANTARQWTAQREDSQYQRLAADLRAAGINPYVLLSSGASPISSSSSGNSYSGSSYTSAYSAKETARHNTQTEAQSWLKNLLSIIPFIAAVAMAVL